MTSLLQYNWKDAFGKTLYLIGHWQLQMPWNDFKQCTCCLNKEFLILQKCYNVIFIKSYTSITRLDH
jgi:hypothetical protein